MTYKIALLPGDGIGPEVLEAAIEVLVCVSDIRGLDFNYKHFRIGGEAIDRDGVPLTDETIEQCQQSDAVMLGAVGGPKWDNPDAAMRPEQGILRLRKALDVWANLRPVKTYPVLYSFSPLKPYFLDGVDIVVIRELTGGIYFGRKSRETVDGVVEAVDELKYKDYEISRIMNLAMNIAASRKKKVTSVDKANVLESSRLWRKIAVETAANYPEVKLDHMLVDTASMKLLTAAAGFDVIVTENMFGDILTDESSVLAGSMGMLPSASLGDGKAGLYEPIHGSAPDIAGRGIANPIGMILSTALMFRYSLKLEFEARAIELAVEKAIEYGTFTPDLGGSAKTDDIVQRVIINLEKILKQGI